MIHSSTSPHRNRVRTCVGGTERSELGVAPGGRKLSAVRGGGAPCAVCAEILPPTAELKSPALGIAICHCHGNGWWHLVRAVWLQCGTATDCELAQI